MVELIGNISSYARARSNDFVIVPQNGDGLLSNRNLLQSIDGFAREDLLYSEKERGERNSAQSIAESVGRLKAVAVAGKPVLVVEYMSNYDRASQFHAEIKELGFVGYVTRRGLKSLSPPLFGCGAPDC